MTRAALLLLGAAHLVAAHFSIEYPVWRADTLNGDEAYSQWLYPCGGVPGNAENRTDWPLSGGSLKLDLHHPWTYIFVNLGIGANVTNFNYTLTPQFWNETGKGTLCVPELPLPDDLKPNDGDEASIQVVTLGESGSALYNCADITFRSSAKALNSSECKTDPGVSFSVVNQEFNGSTSTSPSSSSSSSSSSSPSATGTGSGEGNAGAATGVSKGALTSALALALAFMFGMAL
ncbi:hypothetical protein VTK73DRAFT_2812 [Phialemonium thermophilum]|uniref:Copper acquisition factor BIM1-like domain-containing protein n=1 Tax=Phialemonium thermophilum TaxID=223376 RepID=A0ABR3VP28_9PEZI